MGTISASEARQTLPQQLDRVEAGEEVTITRHGRPVAVLVSPQSLRTRRAAAAWAEADALAERLDVARRGDLDAAAISSERVQQLVDDIYDDRRSR